MYLISTMHQLIPTILTLALVHSQNTANISNSMLLEIFGKPTEASTEPLSSSNAPTSSPTPITLGVLFGKPTEAAAIKIPSSSSPSDVQNSTTSSPSYVQNSTTTLGTISPFLGENNEQTTSVTGSTPITENEDLACITDRGEVGECVRYYLCDSNNTIITDGSTLINTRLLDRELGPCVSYLDTCCLVPNKRPPSDPIKPPPTDKVSEGCGWRNPNGVGVRIPGDDTRNEYARFGEFPWMVAILKEEPISSDSKGRKLDVYVGGGSLIHPNVVLTTAHYVAENRTWRVRAGEWDTQTTKEFYPHQERVVHRVEIHKDFNKKNLFYDIALLFLAKPVTLTPNVGVACLPPALDRAPAGAQCFAMGWGKDKFGKEGRYQTILKKVEIPVVDRETCQNQLRKTRLGRFFELHTSFMCAGGELGKDTCSGDGGAPLVCSIQTQKDRYVQNGMVAWGIGCAADMPAVYVDVGYLRSWIDEKVQEMGYDPASYTFKT